MCCKVREPLYLMTQTHKKAFESSDSEQPPPYTARTASIHQANRYDTQSSYRPTNGCSSTGYNAGPSGSALPMFTPTGTYPRSADPLLAIPSAPSIFQPPMPRIFQPSAPQPPVHGIFQPPPIPTGESTGDRAPPDYESATQSRRAVPQPSSFGGLLSAASSQFLGPRDMHRPLLPVRSLRVATGEMATQWVDAMVREAVEQRDRVQTKAIESIERVIQEGSIEAGQGHKRWEEKLKSGALRFEEDWSGDTCYLKTSNGPLTVQGTIRVRRQLVLENKNGSVTVHGPLFSQGEVQIKVRQGTLQLKGSVQVGRLQILLRQAPVLIESHLESKQTRIKTKNAPITLTQVVAHKRLEVVTNNSPITLHVVAIDADSEIYVGTTHAPVEVYLPSTFSGSFAVSTSASSTARVSTRTHHSEMDFERNDTYKKEGTCKNLGSKANGRVVIRTTHAPVSLYI
ncbi:hypothetical protein BY458DRAFT_490911 [Sporodiniella umbellata]|nr:hypothetical protein BY458DRAFT_490911 [Sporodiniella umbellata]